MQYPKLSGWLAERRAVTKRAELRITNLTKFVSSGKRKIRGLASSISVDREGDSVVPGGAQWQALPIPLLWQHSHRDPVGWVTSIDVRSDGIWIEAEFAEGAGRADEVWNMVDAGLIGHYSIGFRGIKYEPLPSGGRRWTQYELLEISVCVVPMNPDAKISRGSVRLTQADPSLPKGCVRLVSTPLPPGSVRLSTPPLPQGSVRINQLPRGAVRLTNTSPNRGRRPNGIPGNPGAVRINPRGGK